MALFLDDGALARFKVNGARVSVDVAKAIVDVPSVSMSLTQVTQTTVSVLDPDFDLLNSGLFTLGASVTFDDEQMELAVVETGGKVKPVLTLKARSRGPQRLKDERGEKVFQNISPTALASASARSAGMGFRGQSSPTRTLIARTAAGAQGEEAQSQWDLLRDLAAQEGFVMFDVANVLHFGKPSWFVGNPAATWRLGFPSPAGTGAKDIYSLTVPQCRRSRNDSDEAVSVTVTVPWLAGSAIRPGEVLRLSGVPTFSTDYIVDTVDIPLDGRSPVSVTASSPDDPEPREKAVDPGEELGPPGGDREYEGTPANPGVSLEGQRPASSRVGELAWPVRGTITSGYGPRAGGGKVSTYHKGIDIGGNNGYTIHAAAAGRVIRAEYSSSYGWVVYIDHAEASDVLVSNLITRYAHMASRPLVRANVPGPTAFHLKGERVVAGQPIGKVGSTGFSTGPHLHFEVLFRSTGARTDPMKYLTGTPNTTRPASVGGPRGTR